MEREEVTLREEDHEKLKERRKKWKRNKSVSREWKKKHLEQELHLEGLKMEEQDEEELKSDYSPTVESKKEAEVISPLKREDWIQLNVGGKIFQTSRSTLTKDPTSMLATMFGENSRWNSMQDENGAYLIDQDPTHFAPILNYLRTGQLFIDRNIDPDAVLATASYFQVRGVMDLLLRRSTGQQVFTEKKVLIVVLYSGIMYVTGDVEKTLLQKHDWVSGVHKFTPGGTEKCPCFQMQGKSQNLNRGHLLEVLQDLIIHGWTIASSTHDIKNRSDQYTLIKTGTISN